MRNCGKEGLFLYLTPILRFYEEIFNLLFAHYDCFTNGCTIP